MDERPSLADQTIPGYDRAGWNNATIEDDDENEDDAFAFSRAWRRARWGNRQRNHLLQRTPMKGVTDDCTGYQDEAD